VHRRLSRGIVLPALAAAARVVRARRHGNAMEKVQ
jgi:hypothetical protein